MARPNPIQYAERLYAAIGAAQFSPLSFLAFGNAVKDGVPMRHMPRIAAEPFMRVVGEMLDLEEESAENEPSITDAVVVGPPSPSAPAVGDATEVTAQIPTPESAGVDAAVADRAVEGGPQKSRNRGRKE
jgi:hypothetical protein